MLTHVIRHIKQKYTFKKQLASVILIMFLFVIIYSVRIDRLTTYRIKKIVNYNNNDTEIDRLLKYYDSDVWCHYKHWNASDDVLESADYVLQVGNRSIFFIETSCRGDLNVRQLCAIESAAESNPEWNVNVLFAGPVKSDVLTNGKLKELEVYKNVRLLRVHILDYSRNTRLESLISNGNLMTSQWSVSHSSDILRALTLYKYGGVYLDLDVVVVKPFDSLPSNWVAAERDKVLGSSAISFSADETGLKLADEFIRDIEVNFSGDDWGQNGPKALTRAVAKLCQTDTLVNISNSSSCKDVKYFGPEYFFPIPWYEGKRYFESGELPEGDAYGFHVWNKVTESAFVHKDSPYAKLARKFCPNTYERHLEDFGS